MAEEQTVPSQWSEGSAIAKANQIDDWLAIEPDGTVTAFSGKVELGTGVRTALAQIVAEELDVPFERVRMVMGDTARTPDEGYTAGSTTIQFGGSALRRASAEARRALLEMASEQLDAGTGYHLRPVGGRETIQSQDHVQSAAQATGRVSDRRQAGAARRHST
jgi:nicotinate dehydrogenase subunit B